MGPSAYNRENSFMLVLRNLDIELSRSIFMVTRQSIVPIVCAAFASIIAMIIDIRCWIAVIYLCISIVYFSMQLRYILKNSTLKEIRNILYGNTYSIINLNNEKVFNLILTTKELIGMCKLVRRRIIFELILNGSVVTIILFIKLLSNIKF